MAAIQPSATQVTPIAIDGGPMASRLDTISTTLAATQGRLTADNVYAPRLGQEPPANEGTYVDPAGDDEDADRVQYVDKAVNVRAYNNYVKYWDEAAVKSGMVPSAYFQTYPVATGTVKAPSLNAGPEEFAKAVNDVAEVIKRWYVLAQFSGNLQELANAIEATKPKYKSVEGMAPYKPYNNAFREVGTFAVVVGIGLSAVCIWKAFCAD
jgi:hypothetical protein